MYSMYVYIYIYILKGMPIRLRGRPRCSGVWGVLHASPGDSGLHAAESESTVFVREKNKNADGFVQRTTGRDAQMRDTRKPVRAEASVAYTPLKQC